jgi:hypothetical protein
MLKGVLCAPLNVLVNRAKEQNVCTHKYSYGGADGCMDVCAYVTFNVCVCIHDIQRVSTRPTSTALNLDTSLLHANIMCTLREDAHSRSQPATHKCTNTHTNTATRMHLDRRGKDDSPCISSSQYSICCVTHAVSSCVSSLCFYSICCDTHAQPQPQKKQVRVRERECASTGTLLALCNLLLFPTLLPHSPSPQGDASLQFLSLV